MPWIHLVLWAQLDAGALAAGDFLSVRRAETLAVFQSIRFVFEGKETFLGTKVPEQAPDRAFQGEFRAHAAGAVRLDTTVLGQHRLAWSWRRGTETRSKGWEANGILRMQTKEPDHWTAAFATYGYSKYWMGAYLLAAPPRYLANAVRYPSANVDGRRCEVVAYAESPTAGADWRDNGRKFWLDMERGGNFVKMEVWSRKRLAESVGVTLLSKIPGSALWLPLKVRHEYHYRVEHDPETAAAKAVFTEWPTSAIEAYVLRETIVLNDIPAAEALDLAFDNKFEIRDVAAMRRALRNAEAQRMEKDLKPERIPVPKGSEEREAAALAAAQRPDFRAAELPVRRPSAWSSWGWTGGAVGAAALLLGAAFWLRRRGG